MHIPYRCYNVWTFPSSTVISVTPAMVTGETEYLGMHTQLFATLLLMLYSVLLFLWSAWWYIAFLSPRDIVSRCHLREWNYHSLISVFIYGPTCRRSSLVITTKIFWGGKYVYAFFFSPTPLCLSFFYSFYDCNEWMLLSSHKLRAKHLTVKHRAIIIKHIIVKQSNRSPAYNMCIFLIQTATKQWISLVLI